MSTVYGVLRVLSAEADAGRPLAGHTLPERHLVFPITAPVTSLGHDLHNGIVLFDPSVAGEQACLYYQGGAWTLEHPNDEGVVIVEETPIPPHMVAAIFPGQRIQIGDVHLQLLASDLPLSLGKRDDGGDPARSATTALWQDGPLSWQAPTTLGGRAALGLLFVLFCVAFALVVVSLGTLLTHRALVGDGWGVVAALLVPLIPAAGTTAMIVLIDRYEREPWYLLLCAFLWGAVIAIPPAFFIEKNLNDVIAKLPFDLLPRVWADVSQSALFGLNAGLTEEAVKGAGLLVLLYIVRDKFENITDGILYGAIIGAGFAMIENIAYFANADASGRSLTFLILGRVVLGWLGHSTFTACLGAGLGMMREGRMPFRPWLPPLVGFVAGAALHSFFDFVNFQANTAVHNSPGAPVVNVLALLAVILDYGPIFAAQAALWVMLQRSLAREAGILREYLADEVRQNVLSPEEYVTLQRVSVRQRFERGLLLTRSVRLWLATRTLYATAVGLAFAKWRAATKPTDPQLVTAPPNAYRARLRRLHRTLRALDQPTVPPGDSGSRAQRG